MEYNTPTTDTDSQNYNAPKKEQGGKNLWKWIVIFLVIAAIIFAGAYYLFFTGNGMYSGSSTSTPYVAPKTITNPPVKLTGLVDIKNMAFLPGFLTVKKGTIVTWKNDDTVAHTVVMDTVDTKIHPNNILLIQPGGTYTFTFNQIGIFEYHCSIHPYMIGFVRITN
jgi:plastocyanin